MADQADFLVELGTEELPPKALGRLEQAFADGVQSRLVDAGVAMGSLRSFATPRRLAILIDDLQLRQAPQKIEKRGPPTRIAFDADGAPTRAATAFADGLNVTLDELDRLKTDKGEWLIYRGEKPGHDTAELLPDIISATLAELPIPKRMRWGNSDVEFVRPVHWLVMMLGDTVIPATILDVTAGTTTRGHRFHAPAPFSLQVAGDYESGLREQGRVIADFNARRQRIVELAESIAGELNAVVILEPVVLDEVTALVEWPVPVTGNFDPQFLRLPEEVLIATLQDHQRYFPLRGQDGKLIPNFIAMSNLDSSQPDEVRKGNERVIAPRLADAGFFWDTDRKLKLESRLAGLADVIFEKRLGNLKDKSARVAELASMLAAALDGDELIVRRAAELAKTDLMTEMVGEFPKLQGRIGRYYAELDGEDAAVAMAIEEQYLPAQAGGPLPASEAGKILAIADRLDTLAGIFATGKRPTGNKDPFGLRRAALSIIRILIEAQLDVDVMALLDHAITAQPTGDGDQATLREDLYTFMLDRARGYFLDGHAPGLEAGTVTAEIFESVRVRSPASPLDLYHRIVAVCAFMNMDAADSLASANKRIANILKTADTPDTSDIDTSLFAAEQELALFTAIDTVAEPHRADIAARNYSGILDRLASLKEPVDAYFDTVLVMDDDQRLRLNRLATLNRLRQLFLDVADISCIPPR
ncbi:MAG: glycine--tRNA ligase subunit beta [Gammaproteobacteria bacterium]|jgi:glycyl-tRNA synthetase beta chain|nr:glycine--tRNA ligase subunit beta [Chromatiales bacterium]MDP6673742.1 glycine--tRNA ligase subunit beta [Gammaproteobacteria bacterium]